MELKEVKFLSNHIPQMQAGEYIIQAKQKVANQSHVMTDQPFEAQQHFAVGGHRFSLDPLEVDAMFPPQGNLGDHSNVMPHIILKRSTLPWEWAANDDDELPWMALLMLQEDRRWRGSFSKKAFLEATLIKEELWQKLIAAHWFTATKEADVFEINPLEERQKVNDEALDNYTLNDINRFLQDYLTSGVEKPSGAFKKADFQKEINNQENLWQLLLAAQWFFPTNDATTFVTASPTSRKAWASLEKGKFKEETIDLAKQLSSKIDVYFEKIGKIKTVKLSDLTYDQSSSELHFPAYLKFPPTEQMIFEKAEEQVEVMDIEYSLLNTIMPTGEAIKKLTHVRQVVNKNLEGGVSNYGEEKVVLINNRLPAPGANCTAYLVGLQGRFKADNSFNADNAKQGDLVRLVVLKKWSFACLSHKKSFMGLLKSVNGYHTFSENTARPSDSMATATLRLPKSEYELSNGEQKFPKSGQEKIKRKHERIEKYLSQGAVPMQHQLRDGKKIPGWYRGPLTTGNHLKQLPLPKSPYEPLINKADELMYFDGELKMFDVSYAAAWELGRMCLLAQKDVALSLFHWKRRHKMSIRRAEQVVTYEHLPFTDKADIDLEMPRDVVEWFDNLRILKQVPFNYLVPNEKQLPIESIRFFQLDEQWIEALIDGAYSIGRVAYNYSEQYKYQYEAKPVSGILLRSEVVSGWKDLEVDGFDALPPSNNLDDEVGLLDNQLPILRMERLSDNLLLVLFEGAIQTVDIHLKPEAIHFGFDQLMATDTTYQKTLRDSDGTEMEGEGHNFEIAWKNKHFRVVDIDKLTANIKDKGGKVAHSADFAFYMIEGVPKVRFVRG